MAKKAALHNLGCKVNSYELESAEQQLLQHGYEIVPFAPGADIYVINTCTVTNIADRKSRQMLRRAKKMNPDALVVAMGCYAQVKGKELNKDDAIDIVIGNNKRGELLRALQLYESTGVKQEAWIDINRTNVYENISIDHVEEHTRAFVKIQDGCNQFCSYCIIPYARGRVRSRNLPDIIREIQSIADSGCREVVITGIHVCSYGRDLKDGSDLVSVLKAVDQIEGIERIRLGSLEPGSMTEEVIREMSRMKKLCPHFHLSLQSGCDRTLKRMNRKYDTETFRKVCENLRRYFDDPALTTDIITGFPGETDEDFEECRKFVEEIQFYETHIFPYSRREGTRAASFPDQITEAVKKERSRVLLEMNAKAAERYLKRYIGVPVEILIEEKIEKDGKTYWTGHSTHYQKALIPPHMDESGKEADLRNQMITFVPESVKDGCLK